MPARNRAGRRITPCCWSPPRSGPGPGGPLARRPRRAGGGVRRRPARAGADPAHAARSRLLRLIRAHRRGGAVNLARRYDREARTFGYRPCGSVPPTAGERAVGDSPFGNASPTILASRFGGGANAVPSRLVNRNVTASQGRTSMRLEPELWDALAGNLRTRARDPGRSGSTDREARPSGGRTSAVRVHRAGLFPRRRDRGGHIAPPATAPLLTAASAPAGACRAGSSLSSAAAGPGPARYRAPASADAPPAPPSNRRGRC